MSSTATVYGIHVGMQNREMEPTVRHRASKRMDQWNAA
jgi:hypothetical protein